MKTKRDVIYPMEVLSSLHKNKWELSVRPVTVPNKKNCICLRFRAIKTGTPDIRYRCAVMFTPEKRGCKLDERLTWFRRYNRRIYHKTHEG